MKIAKILLLFSLVSSQIAFAQSELPQPIFYRDMTLKIRQKGEFSIPFPGIQSSIKYGLEWGEPVYEMPLITDLPLSDSKTGKTHILRSFYDRILVKDGSFININGEILPLTCVFIVGQDNRFSKNDSPLIPEFALKIYFVANDFSCLGPLKPGWPYTGGREENWDTYIHYEIKDPTIMLPTDAKLRYRWNEYDMVLVDRGEP